MKFRVCPVTSGEEERRESKGSPLPVAVAQFVVVAALSRAMRHVLADTVRSLQRLACRRHWRRPVWRHLLLVATSHRCHGNAAATRCSRTSRRHGTSGTWTLAIRRQLVGDWRHSRRVLHQLHRRLIQMTDKRAVLGRQWYCLWTNTDSYIINKYKRA